MALFKQLLQSYSDTKKEKEQKALKILELERDLAIYKTKLHAFEDSADKTIQPILKEFENLQNTMDKTEQIQHQIEETLERFHDANKLGVRPFTYAVMTSFPPLPKKEVPGIIITPVTEGYTIPNLERELTDLPIQTNKLNCRRTRNGKLLVSSPEESALQQLKDSLKNMQEKIEVVDTKPRKVKIIIFGAPEAPKREHDGTEPLLEQYIGRYVSPAIERILPEDEDRDYHLRVVRIMRGKEPSTSNIVIEIDSRTGHHLLRRRQISIGFLRCRLKLYITVLRCQKCHTLDHHLTENCKNTVVCGICSDNHTTNECKIPFNDKKRSFCINCKEANDYDKHNNVQTLSRSVLHSPLSGKCLQRFLKESNNSWKRRDLSPNIQGNPSESW